MGSGSPPSPVSSPDHRPWGAELWVRAQAKVLYRRSGQALAQAAQGSGGVPIPEGVHKPCGCGSWGHGLAGMGVLGWRLDSMISEVFSKLGDSMIP